MSMVGTFDGFTASRLGIYAAQQSLRVVGNNISNISTPGYTRQRVDQMSFKVGANDRYRSFYDNHIGSGALITGINQIRDPYLDIRYRTTATETYHYDTWLSGLQEIASILDEVGMGENKGDGLLYAQLQDLAEKLRSFSADPTNSSDGLARESANALAALFRNYAGRLDQLYAGTETNFNNSITNVNNILVNIRNLNKSIREAEIHGDMALEMRDERNRQIDELSQYLDIKVQYSYENIGGGLQAEKLTISLNNANPDIGVHSDEAILVDGVFATQLSVPEERPARNMFAKEDTAHTYLNSYLYRREIPASDTNTIDDFLADLKKKGIELTRDQLATTTKKGADGNDVLCVLIGANDSDVDGIVTEKNDNFTIQLGELVNANGEAWKSSTTTWVEVTDTTGLGFATRIFDVSLDKTPAVNDSFEILQANGSFKKYTFVDDDTDLTEAGIDNPVYLSKIENGADFAEFLAGELRKSGRYPEYNIAAENGQLIFTSKTPGAVKSGYGAPTDWPELTVNDPSNTGLFSVAYNEANDKDGYRLDDDALQYDEHGNITRSASYVQVDGRLYQITIGTTYTHKITLDDNDLRGILQAQRELLTEEGEFAGDYDVLLDEEAAIKRGLPYYQKALDLLAQRFAEEYNKLNMGFSVDQDGNYLDKDGNLIPELADFNKNTPLTEEQKQNLIQLDFYLKDKDGNPVDEHGNPVPDDKKVPDLDAWLEKNGAYRPGGVLFSNGNNGNDTTGINAHNIDISAGWSHGDWGLVAKYEKIFVDENDPDGMPQTTQNTNADHMVAMIEKSLTYDPRDLYGSDATGPLLFEGSFNDFLSKIMSVEASDERVTSIKLNNSAVSLTELDYSREGVSGVDLNDEAMDMMQFSKAMSAAMRVMTVIDEVLDRLINNTGIAGR